ncbi:unnamed protein product [Adineta ricciae]|uniref:Poly [ADP-ribose] polymerase n=1 Tax=Adineta ricciae TaxID=249248 RepID=A0A813S8N5_ADIRI|nr:unnamed protein product [Adineta ricciae]
MFLKPVAFFCGAIRVIFCLCRGKDRDKPVIFTNTFSLLGMAEALDESKSSPIDRDEVTRPCLSVQLTQHFHNDKRENAHVEKDFMDDDSSTSNIPCELCSAQVSFYDYEAHYRQCLKVEKQRIADITGHADDELLPCEYCSQLFGIHNLYSHMEQCARSQRQHATTTTTNADHVLIPCEYCSVPVHIEEWTKHTNECAENERQRITKATEFTNDDLIPCEYCDKMFAAVYLEEHQTECRREQLTSPGNHGGEAFYGAYPFPHTWNRSSPYNISRYDLEPSSDEYQYVAEKFRKSLPSNEIVGIERIQNRRWFKQYDAHKDDFIERYGQSTEQWLFHGCKSESVDAIINDCFNRSHAVRCAAGQGIYFATDAAISFSYTQPDASNIRHMFMARVLIGQTAQGNSSTRVCPAGYDTTGGGTVFVTYHDAQAYGEYLISFR